MRAYAQLPRSLAGIAEAAQGTPARIGGEEFAVILPDTTQESAREVAETIRLSVLNLALPHPFSSYGVQTVSLGVAARVPLSDQASIDLMRFADHALYAAKLAGRNQVVCA